MCQALRYMLDILISMNPMKQAMASPHFTNKDAEAWREAWMLVQCHTARSGGLFPISGL